MGGVRWTSGGKGGACYIYLVAVYAGQKAFLMIMYGILCYNGTLCRTGVWDDTFVILSSEILVSG